MGKRLTYLVAGLLLIALLVLVLPGKAKAVVLGLVFILLFIGVFAGIILGLNYVNEVIYPRPRHPTHLCPQCLSLYQDPEDETCEYCVAEFGQTNLLVQINGYMASHSTGDLTARMGELKVKLQQSRGRNILYVEHEMKMLRRLLRMKETESA